MNSLPSKPRHAIAIGVDKYFTGRPCPAGHIAPRSVIGRHCTECRANVSDKHKATVKAWQQRNPDKFKSYKETWRSKNKLAISKKNSEWYEANKDICFERSASRRASKINATPKWLTATQRQEMANEYALARWCSTVMGFKFHVDHIVPLKSDIVCGLHVPWNLRVIPADANLAKGNRLISVSPSVEDVATL